MSDHPALMTREQIAKVIKESAERQEPLGQAFTDVSIATARKLVEWLDSISDPAGKWRFIRVTEADWHALKAALGVKG